MSQNTASVGKEAISERDRLMSLVASAAISQAMAVAAELGVADLLADGPKMAAELARAHFVIHQSPEPEAHART